MPRYPSSPVQWAAVRTYLLETMTPPHWCIQSVPLNESTDAIQGQVPSSSWSVWMVSWTRSSERWTLRPQVSYSVICKCKSWKHIIILASSPAAAQFIEYNLYSSQYKTNSKCELGCPTKIQTAQYNYRKSFKKRLNQSIFIISRWKEC